MWWDSRQKLGKDAIILRWMDDLIIVTKDRVDRGVQRLIRGLSKTRGYGTNLKLVRTGGDEAFGFAWESVEGVVGLKTNEKWLRDHKDLGNFQKNPILYPKLQFVKQGARKGVLKGYYLRLLDCTNYGEEEVKDSCRRLHIGLIEAGHSRKDIMEVVRKIRTEASCKVEDSLDVLQWEEEEIRKFRDMYDMIAWSKRNRSQWMSLRRGG